ncbi:c-type cytochrome [Methylibium sp.]|uniref:c-type cytochrome n=1 Tax=Methylibium sp. TaxID=2067992 RepID=UPI003D115871
MKRWIRRTALGAAVLLGLAAVAAWAGTWYADRKAQRRIDLPPYPLAAKNDPAAIERGHYLYASRGCADCHGDNAGGRVVIDDAKTGFFVRGADISPGGAHVVAAYSPADWERSIRHGVRPDGRPLLVMPSEDYNRLTDDDVAALMAYLQQLPPAAGEPALVRMPILVKLLYAAGVIQDAAEKIDHLRAPSQPVPEDVSVAHGSYVANMCLGCHGSQLSGGKIPGAPPDWPAAANLTPGDGSALTRYADAPQFALMMRSGRRPDGSAVSPVMPFASLARMNDTDLAALYLYLKTVPPRPAGGR